MSSGDSPPCSAQQTEDLKYFEERFRGNIAHLRPRARRWKVFFYIVLLFVTVTAWQWITTSDFSQRPVLDTLYDNPLFLTSLLAFAVCLLCGTHQRMQAPAIIAARSREILRDYNMSVDNTGRLILKPSKRMTPANSH